MSDHRSELSVARRRLEPVLAVVVLAWTAVWIVEPAVVGTAEAVSSLVVLVAVLAPGLLALSVLAGALARGARLVATRLGSDDRTRAGDGSPVGVLASVALGAVAVLTLWWAVGGLYVAFLADAGGVVLAPLAALVAGSVLGVLVLARTLLDRLGSPIRPRKPIVD
ncbi:hypothetical protein [Natronococcus occultus]|uniref:Uncharacterized protein n=1 Tax=Natronococcus occultus SP4 TaxID=694430 RepID=L0JZT4_9EURY|nr:hypothetical protein [Natronococcus occultus]AGB37619.1 hypothetical protein Natoc_1824 [Natronococcus occultus SP4]